MKLNFDKIKADQFRREVAKEQPIYNDLLEAVKPYKGKVTSDEFLTKYKAYLLTAGRENKAFDTVSDTKLLEILELDGQYDRVTNLYNRIDHLEFHANPKKLEDHIEATFTTTTEDPFEKEVATKILDAAKSMEELDLNAGVIDTPFKKYGYRHHTREFIPWIFREAVEALKKAMARQVA